MFTLEQGKFMNPKFSVMVDNLLRGIDSVFLGKLDENEDQDLAQGFLDLNNRPSKIRINTIESAQESRFDDAVPY